MMQNLLQHFIADIGIIHYITLSSIIFCIGLCGVVMNRQNNIISVLMSLELILLAVNINFVAFSAFNGDESGQIFAIFILTVAAAEAAIGLAILVAHFRRQDNISVIKMNSMKG